MGLDKRTGVVFQLGFRIIDVGPKGPSTRREIVSPFILPMEKKLLSVFVDGSGDDGFGKNVLRNSTFSLWFFMISV